MAIVQSEGVSSQRPEIVPPLPDSDGFFSRLSNSVEQSVVFHKSKRAASNTARLSKKLLWSTGKAAWIAGSTFLILVVPLIIEMDREAQLVEFEGQQASLLGAPPANGLNAPSK